jgi:hypothetical protein
VVLSCQNVKKPKQINGFPSNTNENFKNTNKYQYCMTNINQNLENTNNTNIPGSLGML